jgi:hypothetical protein
VTDLKDHPAHQIMDALFRLRGAIQRASQGSFKDLAIVVPQAQFFGIEAAMQTAPWEIRGSIGSQELPRPVTGAPGGDLRPVEINRSQTARIDGTVYLMIEILGVRILTPDLGGDLYWRRAFGDRE